MARTSDASLPGSEVGDLVARCLELAEGEGSRAVEALLEQHPRLATDARQRLARLSQLGFLSGSGALDGPREIPARLGPFRLIERLGAGGMGVVFLAEDETLGREVALKVVRPDLIVFGSARERFQREIEAIARLKHPGILPVYSTGEEGGVPFFAMEYVEGCALSDVLAELGQRRPRELSGALFASTVRERSPATGSDSSAESARGPYGSTWTEACFRIALAVAEALEHAHERGVLHRDVKPSNVMVTPHGRVLLLDFGLAADAQASRITTSGAQVGSLPYMAPEQVRGEELDVTSDVYSLGVTLYELLTLRCPFLAANAELTRKHILEGAPLPIRATNPQVPSDAETVCLAAMDEDPARRYASAAAFAQDLRNVLEHRPIGARRPGLLLRTRRFAQRHPVKSVAALLGSLLVAGAAWFALVQASKNRELWRASSDKDAALAQARAANEGMRTALARREQINAILLRMLGAADPWKTAPLEPLGRDTRVVDVLDRARAEVEENGALDPVVAADVSSLLGGTYVGLGMLAEAEPLLERGLALQRELHGVGSREALQTAWRLASLRFDQRRTAQARALQEETLAQAQSSLPAGDELLVDLWNDLALTLQTTGDMDAAEAIYRQQLAACEAASFPVRELQVALLSHNLGTLLLDRGELQEAAQRLERGLELRRAHLSPGHARILASLNALGILRQKEGRSEESLLLFQEILEHAGSALGEHHEHTLRTRLNVASTLFLLGRHAEAEEQSRLVLAAEQHAPEPGDPLAIAARMMLARSLAGQGAIEAALGACDEVSALLGGPDDPHAPHLERLRAELLAAGE